MGISPLHLTGEDEAHRFGFPRLDGSRVLGTMAEVKDKTEERTPSEPWEPEI